MPTADERMVTTDPAPGKGAWMPKSRGRYPTVKIKKGWEPRSQVGMGQQAGGLGHYVGRGQAVGRGADPLPPGILPGVPGLPPAGVSLDPSGGGGGFAGGTANAGGKTSVTGTSTSPYGYPTESQPQGSGFAGGTASSGPSNGSGFAGGTASDAGSKVHEIPPYQGDPLAPPGTFVSAPRGGGPAQQQGGPAQQQGGSAQQGGGGGGYAAPRGPSPQEMEAIARYAAAQWGVSYEDAMAEIMGSGASYDYDPAAAQQYLQAALGMLRAGAPEMMAFMGGQPDQAQASPPAAGSPPASTPPPAGASPQTPPQTQGGGESQYQKDVRFRDFYQQNPVLHAAQGLAGKYGNIDNAIDNGDGTTNVVFSGGNTVRFNPDGTMYNGAAPGASAPPPAGGGGRGAGGSPPAGGGSQNRGGPGGGGMRGPSAWRAPGGR